MNWIDAVLQGRWIRRFLAVIAVYLLYQIWLNASYYGASWGCWDFMMISGFLAFILAVSLATDLERRLSSSIDQLRLNNVLVIGDDGVQALKQSMSSHGRKTQFWSGVLITTVIFGSYLWVLGPLSLNIFEAWQSGRYPQGGSALTRIGIFTFISALAAGLAGLLFGRLTHYGTLASILSVDKQHLRIIPDHFDHACGLKPIGDYYLYQALIFAVPILWLGAWWAWIIPTYKDTVCVVTGQSKGLFAVWQGPFFVQWLVVLFYFHMGFVRPFMALRRRIQETKANLNLDHAERLEKWILDLQNQLAHRRDQVTDNVSQTLAQLDAGARQLWAIRHMSTWPMDAATLAKYRSLLIGEIAIPISISMATSDRSDGTALDWFNTLLSKLF